MKTNYLCGLFLLCVLVWGRSEAHAEKPLKTLDLYLCIGQSNMAGRGKLSPEVMDTLQNVYLLNADDQFEPAVNPLNRYSTISRRSTTPSGICCSRRSFSRASASTCRSRA